MQEITKDGMEIIANKNQTFDELTHAEQVTWVERAEFYKETTLKHTEEHSIYNIAEMLYNKFISTL